MIFVLESREIFYTEITNIVNIVGFFSFSDSYTTGKYLELKFELKEVPYVIKNAYLIPKWDILINSVMKDTVFLYVL